MLISNATQVLFNRNALTNSNINFIYQIYWFNIKIYLSIPITFGFCFQH